MDGIETVFETTRLVGGKWNRHFAEQAFEIYGDAEVTKYINRITVESVPAMREKIDEIIARDELFANEKMGSFPVFLKSTGSLIGTALIKPLPRTDGSFSELIEIGWHLARRQWGRGYATEYGKKLIEIGFQDLDLDELHAVVETPNENSKKVALRLGMKHVGLTTDFYEGHPIDHYVIRRNEFEAAEKVD